MAKNTLGETPVLLLDDGRYLTESMAICRYFEALNPEPRLMGADATECAFVEMWTRRAEQQLMNPIANFAQHSFEFFADKIDQIPAFAESQKQLMVKKWAWLDQEMADGRPYLAGDTFTVADIAGMAALKICDYAELVINDGLTHAKTWEARVRGRESWAA